MEKIGDMKYDFNVKWLKKTDVNVLLAWYCYEYYSGSAYVLFKNTEGKLFEVHGSHCSCYGLEGQWEPEETNAEALRHWIQNGHIESAYKEQLKQIVREL